MRISNVVVAAAALAPSVTTAAAIQDTTDVALDTRSPADTQLDDRNPDGDDESLWKRKGGGGGGGRGGSSGSSSGSRGGSSSGSSSSGSSGSRGSSGTGSSGVRPSYGGGRYYGGGATTPYQSGKKSPGGILPFVVGGAAIGFLGGAYLASGAYSYPWAHRYYYHNATTDKNETHPVYCICKKEGECSCDDNGDEAYFNSIIGDGSYQNLNKSLVTTNFNKTANETYIYIIGDVPKGTTASSTEGANATGGMASLLRAAGWWPAATAALALALV